MASRKSSTSAGVAGSKRARASGSGPAPSPRARTRAAASAPALLAGDNPRVPKGDGEGPVRAWIEGLPGWKRAAAERLDALILAAVPGAQRAIRWTSPVYGLRGRGWFVGVDATRHYLKLAFFRGASLQPPPPEPSRTTEARYLHLHQDEAIDETRLTDWLRQAAALPGWEPGSGRSAAAPSPTAPSPEVDAWARRARLWPDESARLRLVLRTCGLDETLKWGKPCYTLDGANIAIIQEMKGFLALMFFKGSLMDARGDVLVSPGKNSRFGRRIELTSLVELSALEPTIEDCVREAIALERSGRRVEPTETLELVPELRSRLDADPALAAAFAALTPGRQRAYDIHFSGAKQPRTRMSRIEKCVPRILAGKGFRDP